MAVIGTIRKQSGLLIIIVGVALAAFILGDFLKGGPSRGAQNIAEIYGDDVTYQQFNALYEQNLENQKRNQQKDNLTAEEIHNLKEQTWNQLIEKIVLGREYEELGLVVSADELLDQLQGDEPHSYIAQVDIFKDPATQQYSPDLVRTYISQLKDADVAQRNQWSVFVDAVKDDRIKTKYRNLVSKGYFIPDTFLVKDYDERKTTANLRIVGVRYNTVNDTAVNVTDNDLEKYYNDYKQNYITENARDIKYVVFDVKPSEKDRANIREDVMDLYEAFKVTDNEPLFVNAESDNRYDSIFYKQGELPVKMDSVMFNSPVGTFVAPYVQDNAWHMAKLIDVQMRPDSMKASHILIAYSGAYGANPETTTRINVDAKNLADSLLNVLKANPSKMEELAKEFSDDPSAATNSGDLGWFADGNMVYPFNKAVLEGKVGEFTTAQSVFGYHVIQITNKQEATKKVRVAIVDRNITASQETNQMVYAKASEFQGNATTMEAFDTLATSIGLSPREANNLQAMANRIAGLEYPRGIIQWSFIEGIGVGSVSQVFTQDDKYVVAMVTKVTEKGIPDMEDLRERLMPLVTKDMKGDIVVAKLTEAASTSKNLTEIAKKLNAKVDTIPNININSRGVGGFGNEPNVLAKAFTMDKGIISAPIKGNNAAFFVVVDDRNDPPAGGDMKTFEQQMLMAFRSKVSSNGYLQPLKDKAGLLDNRVRFY
jgi:peptidyl-prolyl cis-trans isomerase D